MESSASAPQNPDQPVQPEVVPRTAAGPAMQPPPQRPQYVYVNRPPSLWRRIITWIGWAGFLGCLFVIAGLASQYQSYFGTSNGLQEAYHSGARTGSDKVAIIEVSGMIGAGDGFVKKQIDRVKDDEDVKAVVLRVDSPGGTITGSDYIYHHLNELRKERDLPLVVSMGSIAASGGYYVAMAVGDTEKSIYAEPTTTTGSIGVIIPHYDVSGFLERYDIKDDSIASHPRKQMLSMTRPLSDDDRQVIEAYLNEAFDRFKDVVKSGRPAFRGDDTRLNELATGEIFTATQAKEGGLVDELGFIEAAIDRAIELAGLDPDDTRVVHYKAPMTLVDALTAVRSPQTAVLDWQTLAELSVPKAYYLTTSLPALASQPQR